MENNTEKKEVKIMTFKEKIKACYKILFKNKPIGTITYGIKLVRCSECENNIRCEECVHSREWSK